MVKPLFPLCSEALSCFCAFTPADLLNIHPGMFVYPPSLSLSSAKGQAFLCLCSQNSPPCALHYVSIPSLFLATYSLSGLLSCQFFLYFPHPLPSCSLTFFAPLHIYFLFICLQLQWSRSNKVIRKKGKYQHAHARSLSVPQPAAFPL